MMELEEIKAALQDRIDSKVAERTGLTSVTIWRIKTGRAKKPHNSVLRVLSDYLQNNLND